MDSCTNCYDFVRIDTLERIFAKNSLDLFDNGWHARHTADQNDLVDVARFHIGVFEGFFDRLRETIDEVCNELFEFRTCHPILKVLWTVSISGDKWQINLRFGRRREFFLGFFSFVLEALHSGFVTLEIDAFFFLEDFEEMIDDAIVKIFTAEVRIAIG